jgi:hypothetical protein
MTSYRSDFTARLAGSALFALGLAATAATAHAQTDRGQAPTTPPSVTGPAVAGPSIPRDNPEAVAGVTVEGRARPALSNIPKDKLEEFDAAAAHDAAFRSYRESTPRISADPNDQSKDFPGLQAYVPPK